MKMTFFSISCLLLISIIGCSLAGPIDNNNSNESVVSNNACVDYYDSTCKNGRARFQQFSRKTYENNINDNYKHAKQIFTDILASEGSRMDLVDYDSPAINLEQQLYQSCMRLGSETHENKDENVYELDSLKSVFNPILQRFGGEIDENAKWQDLVEELSKLGLGTVFFDISVTKDPENPNKNIILVQPPSMNKWNSVNVVDTMIQMLHNNQKKIYNYCKNTGQLKSNDKNSSNELRSDDESVFLESTEFKIIPSTEKSVEIEPICKKFKPGAPEFDLTDLGGDDSIILINKLIKYIMRGVEKIDEKDSMHKKFTIKTWNETYNQFKQSDQSMLDWVKLIQTEFEKAGIAVDDNEQVFVRNLQYFNKMATIFGNPWRKNSYMVKTVQNIIVAENIRYYDWEYAQKLQLNDKSSFCFEQTNLYGLSEAVLKTAMRRDLDPFVSVSKNIINGIVQVFNTKISKAQGLTEADKATLKAHLKAITQNSLDNHDIDNHFKYDDIELTGDYLVDIHKYRSMVKNMVLSSLRKNPSSSPTELFSLSKLENNRNRFILYTIFEAANQGVLYVHPFIGKEAYYATFGVNIARFLHTLLIERQYENVRDRRGSEWLIPRNTYSANAVKCFVPENILTYGYQLAYSTIAEIFSVRIASEALKKDDEDNLSIEEFYKAYIRTQCDAESKMVKKVLSNLDELPEALSCSASKTAFPKCEMDVFEK